MIRKIIYRFMKPRHFWRDVQFDELSELYSSMLLKSLGLNVLFVFVPFFLYQHGFSIQQIFLVYAAFFATRVIMDILSGFLVARIGPKHTQILSTSLFILNAAQFLTLPTYHWSIVQLGAVWGAAGSLYFISFHTQFSKIKHTLRAGKEISYMNMMDKLGAFAGPLIGGVVGATVNPEYIFLAAAAVLIMSLWPLFLTPEPVKTRQKLSFNDFPLEKIKYDLISYVGVATENTFCVNLWPLYISLFALGTGVYLKLGVLSALGVLFALLSNYLVGQVIDKRNAKGIFERAVWANAALYLVRPFVSGVGGVFAINIANEAVTAAYRMPYVKGMYSAADEYPGHRIVYIVLMESVGSFFKGLFWLIMVLFAGVFPERATIIIGFAIASTVSLLMLSQRFTVLRRG